jgi:hypothetical protein
MRARTGWLGALKLVTVAWALLVTVNMVITILAYLKGGA